MSIPLLQRSCPSCGAVQPSSQSVMKSAPSGDALSLEEMKPHWNGLTDKKAFIPYHRCPQCQLLYCPNYFLPDQLNQLYGQMPDNSYGVPPEVLRRTQRTYFETLREFSDLKGEFLEVGPDMGLFVDFCVQFGGFDHYWLFEPKAGAQETLRKVLKGKNNSIFQTMLDAHSLPEKRITAVVMVHVLDHLLHPKTVLAELKQKLAPGAVVLIVTHDESSLLARIMQSRWGGYAPEHPQLFSARSISTLMENAGFKVLAVRKTTNYFPFSFLFNHLMKSLSLRFRLPVRDGWAFGLRLGNIITVASPVSKFSE